MSAFREIVRWFRSLRSSRPASPVSPTVFVKPAPEVKKVSPATGQAISRQIVAESSPQGREDYGAAVARIADHLPYRAARSLLTDGERAFWHPLCLAVDNRYLIFCKVRLADLAIVSNQRTDSHRRFQDISAFHVDFVLCDPRSIAPLLIIELDDPSHAAPHSINRDRFKDAVLKAAGLPILRVECRQAYSPIELANRIARRILPRGR